MSRVDLLTLHGREASEITRKGMWVLLAGVLPISAWLALAPLSSAVVAPGYVKVDLNRRTVQHAEGGTVRSVFVRDGQKVKAGEVLLELGDVAVSADKTRLSYRLLAERASVLRLETEQIRGGALVWPAYLLEAAKQDAALSSQLVKEQSLFSARRDALRSQSALLREQRSKVLMELQSLRAQISAALQSMAAQKAELESNRTLVSDGFIASTRILQLEAAVADYAAKLEERRADLVRAEQRIVDIDLKLQGLDNEYRQQASDQLKTANVRVQDIEQELRKASDASSRQLISAPVDGEVIGLRVTNPGTVIAPREPIMDVLQNDPKLLVEARIRTEDVNRVHTGQHAEIRFTAYNYRSTRLVRGSVYYLSPDRLIEQQNNQAYYTVHIEVDANDVANATQGEKLKAGMPAEVYIQGETRTPLQYLFEPVTQVLRRAGRER
ncbi:HlyD family type I secretion periplasmic adaptor subunit [Sphaerotilus microaerophilus]|uniref:HlyD family type I secretion periplasmic adaptor subunit n=1 Tax=Sphaerotilus microaerophilus TaxID=2914710 RepID=UPI002072B22C|nr:HlyD family type I secretion periplasmic adaptor subunit [Sphaerotilus sp. FB-5]